MLPTPASHMRFVLDPLFGRLWTSRIASKPLRVSDAISHTLALSIGFEDPRQRNRWHLIRTASRTPLMPNLLTYYANSRNRHRVSVKTGAVRRRPVRI